MGERIQLQHDDGYPAGFTLLDNRDIWGGNRRTTVLLSVEALGVYTVMRSQPKGWEFREPWLLACCGIGKHVLRRIIRELEAKNRLARHFVRDERGRYIRTVWTLIRGGEPLTKNQSTACSMSEGDPLTNSRATGNPVARKPRRPSISDKVNKEEAVSTETTTTAPATLDWSDPALNKLTDRQRVVVGEALSALDTETQQDVLDELTDYADKGDFTKGPVSLAKTLVTRAKEGDFNFDRGMKVRERRLAKARPEKKRRPGEDSESPYENAVAWARQQFGVTKDQAELAKRLAEAAEKWPEEARRNSVAALTYGKRDTRKQSKHNLPTMQGAAT